MNKPTSEARAILDQLRREFEELYGDRLRHLVLFGSHARGEAESGSDIDVLVVLRGPVQPGEEIDRTSKFVADLCLRSETVIGTVFMDEERYHHRNGPLLRNIRREGIAV